MSLPLNQIINGDCLEVMKGFTDNCIDLVVTDPPYGYSFMGKDWDKVVPKVEIWRECLRVLKDGAFAFVMSSPRQDVLSRMIVNLGDAGFNTGFTSIYWNYASGFPKAMSISKAVDKKLGVKGEVIGESDGTGYSRLQPHIVKEGYRPYKNGLPSEKWDKKIYGLSSPEAKKLDGSYAGFQPKPAVEVILVAMKPLSEKTYVEQALKNGKGVTWLDDCRIPYVNEDDIGDKDRFKGYPILPPSKGWNQNNVISNVDIGYKGGRFPANIICSNDVLNDGRILSSGKYYPSIDKMNRSAFPGDHKEGWDEGNRIKPPIYPNYSDSGSFSRYFDLDRWWSEQIKKLPESVRKTFPFLLVPKASKGEREEGCEELPNVKKWLNSGGGTGISERENIIAKNFHPTVKPVKLMSYLVTLGSREGDIVLDHFCGSGTTCVASKILHRTFIGIELNKEYCDIAEARLKPYLNQNDLTIFLDPK